MTEDPTKGDWIHLVKEDLESIDMSIEDEEKIEIMTEEEFKKIVKEKIRQVAFKELEETKASHEKVRTIIHSDLKKPQGYLSEPRLDNKEKSILFNLRSRSINEFRDNFHNRYQNIDCPMCGKSADTQEHALTCEKITQQFDKEQLQIQNAQTYNDLFSTIDKQIAITKTYKNIMEIRQRLRSQEDPDQAHHGLIVDLEDDT